MSNIIEKLESEVRFYCREYPTTFVKAEGSYLFDIQGKEYLDFFSGAGALNYGHNHPVIREALLNYICSNGITHGLDLFTQAKEEFLETFNDVILSPRSMVYKVQFTGPTGTNAVEAALKLARKFTSRQQVGFFKGAFHGMSLGSLSISSNPFKRSGAGIPLEYTIELPFDNEQQTTESSLSCISSILANLDKDNQLAAVIIETIQAEGGINVARLEWLVKLSEILKEHQILLIVDDIQVGCGRTGSFFSFEEINIEPDIICLSKSLSGYGLPLSVNLIKPHIDVWKPGEHNGTFRGFNHAFVTATATMKEFWKDSNFKNQIERNIECLTKRLFKIVNHYNCNFSYGLRHVGKGMIQGIYFPDSNITSQILTLACESGLLVDRAGIDGNVLKLLPAIIITEDDLNKGIDLTEAIIEIILTKQNILKGMVRVH
jgi:diaminobutyrate-2-oxoglutarate transaminase